MWSRGKVFFENWANTVAADALAPLGNRSSADMLHVLTIGSWVLIFIEGGCSLWFWGRARDCHPLVNENLSLVRDGSEFHTYISVSGSALVHFSKYKSGLKRSISPFFHWGVLFQLFIIGMSHGHHHLRSLVRWMFVEQLVWADIKKINKSSTLLAFVKGIHQWLMDSPHKGPVIWKVVPFCYVITCHFTVEEWHKANRKS